MLGGGEVWGTQGEAGVVLQGWRGSGGRAGGTEGTPALTSSLPAGSEQSLSARSPVSTWAYLQHLRAIDSQKELLRLSRELEP